MPFVVPDLEEPVDDGVHDGVEAGEEEQRFLDPLVDVLERLLVDHEPDDDEVVRGPAEDEHDHDHHRHLQGLGFGTVQKAVGGASQGFCNHKRGMKMALGIML